MTGAEPSPHQDIEDIAIGWALRHADGTMGLDDIEDFAAWLRENPEHGRAFDAAMATWAMFDKPRFEPEILALRNEALGALHDAQRRGRRWRIAHPARLALMAASLVLATAAGLYVWLGPHRYETATGERRVVALADGSILSLDAQSSVTVDYRADGRHLTLEKGRATFTVAKDPLHPFSVFSHGSMVVATGTQFGVEWLGGETRVVLYEGHVAILRKEEGHLVPGLLAPREGGAPADTMLVPGREAVVPEDTGAVRLHVLDDPRAQRAWEQGQIDVADEPLGIVVARMNRYLPGPHLLVAGDAADIRISGLFNPGDLEAFVSGVTQIAPLVAQQQGDGSFCLRRQRNSSQPCR